MSLWRQLTYGLTHLLHRSRRSQDVAAEVEQYMEAAIADWQQRGLSREEAVRAARRDLGNPAGITQQARSYGWENTVHALGSDLRFAGRQLRKHPVFTATATLTLALGIGANTAIFTVVQSVLLAPLPYVHPDRIAALTTAWSDTGKVSLRMTGADGADLRDQAHSLAAVSLYSGGTVGVQLRNHSVYTSFAEVDSNFARVFTLHPLAGRLFTDSDANRAALISEAFARDHFGSASSAIGQVIHVEGQALEVAGVLPSGFNFPADTQVWQAAPLQPESKSRTAFNYKAVALLRPGTSFAQAQTDLDAIAARLQSAYPADNRAKSFRAQPLRQVLTGDARPTLLLLWATVALILLIACANLMHLQLVRSMERQRELAVRKALGSSRWQVMRPVLMEGLLLSVLGGVSGVLLAFPLLRALLAMAPQEMPRAAEIHLNIWVLAFALALAVVTALGSSLLPAWRASSVDAADALKQDTSRGLQRKSTAALRSGLVVAEIAATFVLSMGAALLLHTMASLLHRNLGFRTQQMLVVDADLPAHTTEDAQRAVAQFQQIFAKLASIPGVEKVGAVMGLPTGNYGSNGYYETRDGLALPPGQKPWANFSVASSSYFDTLGIPLQRGRDFGSQDTYQGPFVAVISESLARQSFGSADPIGRQIRCGLDTDKWMTVVGVVGDVRQESPAQKPGPALYMPMAQHPFYANQIHIVLRTAIKPLNLLNTAQAKIVSVNPLIATRYTTLDAMVNKSMAAERFRAILISGFAAVGLLLATLGVYGTMAYSVSQRTFEIGIRMAFGAQKTGILRNVLGRAALLALYGISAGVILSLMLTRLVANLLSGVGPMDPLSLVSAAALLLLTALAAGFAPGWRATRVEPMRALRVE